jgi:A/G-specific adenine glycosylase
MRAQTSPIETRFIESRRTAPVVPRVNSAVPTKNPAPFRRALLRWYDQHRRNLPWRETRDPYPIWLSEIMLQQTRVAAVLEHYRIFLERFPNVQALAAASEDAVLAAWSGLGYYRRARMLYRCAKELGQKHGGHFPQTAEGLQSLPGIGRYTAAAIASIAFGEPVAVVDGNVERVIQRLIGTNIPGVDLKPAQVWQHAQTLLATSRSGDSNQAMMELGATVCVPAQPRCLVCPVPRWCSMQPSGKSMGDRTSRPGKALTPAKKGRQVKKEVWCSLHQRNGAIRLVQRARSSSLMPGMWELPQSSHPPRSLLATAPWRTFRHSITATNYTVHVLRNQPLRNDSLPNALPGDTGKWIAIDRIPQIPITGLTRKILKAGGII